MNQRALVAGLLSLLEGADPPLVGGSSGAPVDEGALADSPDDADRLAGLAAAYRDAGDPAWLECAAATADRRPPLPGPRPAGDLGMAADPSAEPGRRQAATRRLLPRLPVSVALSLARAVAQATGDTEELARQLELLRRRLTEATRPADLPEAVRRGLASRLAVALDPSAAALVSLVASGADPLESYRRRRRLATLRLDAAALAELRDEGLRQLDLLARLEPVERRRVGRAWAAETAETAAAIDDLEGYRAAVAILVREPAPIDDRGVHLALAAGAGGRLGVPDEAVELAARAGGGWIDRLAALDAAAAAWPRWPAVAAAPRLLALRETPAPPELADWRDAVVAGHLAAAGGEARALGLAGDIVRELPRTIATVDIAVALAGRQPAGAAELLRAAAGGLAESRSWFEVGLAGLRLEAAGAWTLSEATAGIESAAAHVNPLDAEALAIERALHQPADDGDAAAWCARLAAPAAVALVDWRRRVHQPRPSVARLASLVREIPGDWAPWARAYQVRVTAADRLRGLAAVLADDPAVRLGVRLVRQTDTSPLGAALLTDRLERATAPVIEQVLRRYRAAVSERLEAALPAEKGSAGP